MPAPIPPLVAGRRGLLPRGLGISAVDRRAYRSSGGDAAAPVAAAAPSSYQTVPKNGTAAEQALGLCNAIPDTTALPGQLTPRPGWGWPATPVSALEVDLPRVYAPAATVPCPTGRMWRVTDKTVPHSRSLLADWRKRGLHLLCNTWQPGRHEHVLLAKISAIIYVGHFQTSSNGNAGNLGTFSRRCLFFWVERQALGTCLGFLGLRVRRVYCLGFRAKGSGF